MGQMSLGFEEIMESWEPILAESTLEPLAVDFLFNNEERLRGDKNDSCTYRR
jgi:hypothetical protein